MNNNILPIDKHFANYLLELEGSSDVNLYNAIIALNYCSRQKNICLNEDKYQEIKSELDFTQSYTEIVNLFNNSNICGVPGEYKPIILSNSSIYLYRYWEYENIIASKIKEILLLNKPTKIDISVLDKYFPIYNINEFDYQRAAALLALSSNFAIITGGPGTGKTSTITKILACIFDLEPEKEFRIALAAPTGKAATRIQEAIKNNVLRIKNSEGSISEDIERKLLSDKLKPSTIHRLLGSNFNSPYFKHNAKNLLNYNIIIVDEVSMVDIPLLAKLLLAVEVNTKIILVGDRNQLSSVEAGSFLGDVTDIEDIQQKIQFNYKKLVDNSLKELTFRDCIVELSKVHRTDNEVINQLSQYVKNGNSTDTIKLAEQHNIIENISSHLKGNNALLTNIYSHYSKYFSAIKNSATNAEIDKIFAIFNDFKVLCALRNGVLGADNLNTEFEKVHFKYYNISGNPKWYQGKAIMITTNDYKLKLYNGDIGIALTDENNELRVYFQNSDGTIRKLNTALIPAYESAYFITIHKSQGSEYNNIFMILSSEDNPVITRELIYTGITRAKKEIKIITAKNVFEKSIVKKIVRTSGLQDQLV